MSARFLLVAVAGCIVVASLLSAWQTYRECRGYYGLDLRFCASVVLR